MQPSQLSALPESLELPVEERTPADPCQSLLAGGDEHVGLVDVMKPLRRL